MTDERLAELERLSWAEQAAYRRCFGGDGSPERRAAWSKAFHEWQIAIEEAGPELIAEVRRLRAADAPALVEARDE
jgi:hypothetical protein